MNFLAEILKTFESQSSKNAFYIDGNYYSYNYLSKRVSIILNSVKDLKPNSLVGIFTFDHIDTYATIIAILFSSHGFVPLNINFPFSRNKEIIDFANIETIITAKNTEYTKSFLSKKIIVTSSLSEKKSIDIATTHEIKSILFTSGSTGKPKGVPYSHENINTTLDSFFDLYNLNSNDKVLQMFELTFDMSMLSYLPALCVGACVYTLPATSIRYLAAIKLMKEFHITYAAMVPSTLNMLKPYFNKLNLPKLRYSVLGGEPFHVELARQWKKCIPNAQIHNISGPTETCMACMGYTLEEDFEKNKSRKGVLAFGNPWKNTSAIIVDEENSVCGQNQIGELCFSGTNVMQGYFRQKELDKNIFFEYENQRFYKTGDLAYFDDDGCYHTCGRKDHQVKIQGFKVELVELENTVKEILKIDGVVAVSKKNNKEIDELHLAIEMEEKETSTLIEKLKTKLPPYMLPTSIHQIDKIPMNLNGKVDRQKVKELIK